ncbi:hypothetical protein [Parapedobacter sp. DT-150]|uniref:hypothetical protein n=1 Tax=Parapedobacter sp. DT-150 TaxID=3396162 RepID=UPI003F1BC27B
MNKKLTYPLLVLVLILWGVIFYRIFSGWSDEESAMPLPQRLAERVAPERPVDDSLLLDYRDPFLDNVDGETPMMTEDSLAMAYEYVEETPYVDWSQVQYLGSVNSTGGKAVALVSINGKEYMLKPGETVDGYTLVGQVGSSIAVRYQGQVGTIALQGQ